MQWFYVITEPKQETLHHKKNGRALKSTCALFRIDDYMEGLLIEETCTLVAVFRDH